MICPQSPQNERNCNILSPERPFFLLHINFETHFHKFTRRQQEEWPSYSASVPALILLVPNEFTNWGLCQHLSIAAIIVLDGQSPANAWSAPLRNEASKSFSQTAEELRSSIFNNLQLFAKESVLFCIWLPPKNGAACFPFRKYFQRFHHNSLNTRNNGKAAKLPKVKLDFECRSFYFLDASIFNSPPLSLRKIINS